jgi:hypothetical protein
MVLPEIEFFQLEEARSNRTTRMEINRAINDSIDDSEPPQTESPSVEVPLLQVRGGFGSSTTSWRRILIAY